jgi:PAS domain S-box-containing protein
MKFFRDISIQKKQMLIIMITSGAALLLACLAFATYDIVTFRRTIIANVSMLTEVVGNTTTAALDFNDPKAAQETLAALKGEADVVHAAIYNKVGDIFAVYRRSPGETFNPPPVGPTGFAFKNKTIRFFRPILSNGELIGTVYVERDLHSLYSRLRQYILIVAAVFSASALLAFALSARLQRIISGPILHLVETARDVAREQNYSRRAVRQSADELGVLVDSFNEMLTQIQQRDAQLQKAKDLLEIRVEARTRELRDRTDELAYERDLLKTLLENSPEVIYFKDHQSRYVRHSKSVGSLRNIRDSQAFLGKTDFDFFSEEHAKATYEIEQEILRTGEPLLRKLEKQTHPDGRVTWAVNNKLPWRDHTGQIIGTFGISQDITSMKEAEARLEEVHKQLVDASRQAGMAEVATSVLHNVGNVLNSINVSTTVVTDHVRKSRTSDLSRLVKLLAEHQSNLGEFFSKDPRSCKVPEFLKQLTEKLAAEQTTVLSELASLRKNVEHVKDIVAMQQSYAKVSGLVEAVDVTELLEDSLRMNSEAFVRHDVQLVREYSLVAPVMTDRHKVLQILVNLVRNAKYACDDSGRNDKQVTVRVSNDGDWVRISIVDNGIGIQPENLDRIFNHGFTTRKHGHGFGLHGGALAARELGGRLAVHSDGNGQGATFTLELPKNMGSASSSASKQSPIDEHQA